MEDEIDVSVTPYRLIIDYSMTDAELLAAYNEGKLFFVGDIPLSLRSKYTIEKWEDEMDARVTDALSTHSYIFNENAVIGGKKLFADKNVRLALSLAIDRNAIAKAIVFAEAANGLVPNGVFNSDSADDTFRDNDSAGISASLNTAKAKEALAKSNIVASNYSFAISVPAYDEVHVKIAEMVAKSWKQQLGFNVTVKKVELIDNKDPSAADAMKTPSEIKPIAGIKDDIFFENYYAGNYEVAAIDYTAFSTDAFSVLAPFAKGFTGEASVSANSTKFTVAPHACGFDNDAYNKKIAEAFKEKDLDKRAVILHAAEDILMKEMPIMPIVFNKSVILVSDKLDDVEFSYYSTPIFTKAELADYKQYIPTEETN
jgi:ABC-type transport system substrate-binding protein